MLIKASKPDVKVKHLTIAFQDTRSAEVLIAWRGAHLGDEL